MITCPELFKNIFIRCVKLLKAWAFKEFKPRHQISEWDRWLPATKTSINDTDRNLTNCSRRISSGAPQETSSAHTPPVGALCYSPRARGVCQAQREMLAAPAVETPASADIQCLSMGWIMLVIVIIITVYLRTLPESHSAVRATCRIPLSPHSDSAWWVQASPL